MTDVTFTVADVAPEPFALVPRLLARVAIIADADEPVQAIALRAQVRIEPSRRSYTDEEAAGVLDLFGPRERWAHTQRTFVWQHATAMVTAFTGTTGIALPLECSYDFEVAASKYLHAMRTGAIPLQFLFSGTVFGYGERGLSVGPVSWECEADYDLPVSVWQDLMQRHFPGSGWVRLDHDTVAALAAYRATRGLLNLDEAVASLLACASEDVR
jgi:hypothetical protein